MVVGGAAAELGGGKFANGARTAAFAYLFIHEAHDEKGGYREAVTVNGKTFNVRYSTHCGNTICTMNNANLDQTEPETPAYFRELYGQPLDAISAGGKAAQLAPHPGVSKAGAAVDLAATALKYKISGDQRVLEEAVIGAGASAVFRGMGAGQRASAVGGWAVEGGIGLDPDWAKRF